MTAIISPLLAELLAYCDYNNNLDILKNPVGHWKHQLWLAILANSHLTEIRYEGFLSPTQYLREKAMVKMSGFGNRPMTANIPFSWLLKEYLEDMYEKANELKGNTTELDKRI